MAKEVECVADTFVCTKGRGKYRECQILKKMIPFFYVKLEFFWIGSIFKSSRRTLPVSAFIKHHYELKSIIQEFRGFYFKTQYMADTVFFTKVR